MIPAGSGAGHRVDRKAFRRLKAAFCRDYFVLVLSGAVLVLLLEWGSMPVPIFDHEKLDVYRLSIDYVAASYPTARGLAGANRQIRDQWFRGSIHPVEHRQGQREARPQGQAPVLRDRPRIGPGMCDALECAAIHDMLKVFAAVDEEPNHTAKLQLRRIVSMLARLIQQTDRVAQERVEYE